MQRGRKEKEKPILLLTREFKTVKNKARKSVAIFFASITSVFTHRHSSEPLIQGFFSWLWKFSLNISNYVFHAFNLFKILYDIHPPV